MSVETNPNGDGSKLRTVRLSDAVGSTTLAGASPVPGYVYGLTLLYAEPKARKTFLAIQLSACIASGTPFLGWKVNQGNVLYIDFENGQEEIRRRFSDMVEADSQLRSAEENFHLAESEAVDYLRQNGLKKLKELVTPNNYSLIVIDPIAPLQADIEVEGNAYTVEYRWLGSLRGLSSPTSAILAIYHDPKYSGHKRKMDRAGGTRAVTGAPDCLWEIQKQKHSTKFNIEGRRTEEMSLELSFDGRIFTRMANQEEPLTTQERVKEYLRKNPGSTPRDVAAGLQISRDNARQTLKRLKKRGIVKNEGGRYFIDAKKPRPQRAA